MMPLLKRTLIALSAGLSLSLLLLALETLTTPPLRYIWARFQLPGFLVGASIWGVHSGGNAFLTVMVMLNGFIFGSLFLLAWHLFQPADK